MNNQVAIFREFQVPAVPPDHYEVRYGAGGDLSIPTSKLNLPKAGQRHRLRATASLATHVGWTRTSVTYPPVEFEVSW